MLRHYTIRSLDRTNSIKVSKSSRVAPERRRHRRLVNNNLQHRELGAPPPPASLKRRKNERRKKTKAKAACVYLYRIRMFDYSKVRGRKLPGPGQQELVWREKLTPYIAPVDIRRTVRRCILACPEESHQLAFVSLSWDKIGADTSIQVVRHRRRHRRLRHPRRPPPPRRQLLPPRSMGTSPTITPERARGSMK